MIAALQALVEGRLDRKGYGPYDIRLVRVAALAALARNKSSNAQLVATVDMAPQDMATGTLADWLVALARTPGVRKAPRLRAEAEAEPRTRPVYEGTRPYLPGDAKAPRGKMMRGDHRPDARRVGEGG